MRLLKGFSLSVNPATGIRCGASPGWAAGVEGSSNLNPTDKTHSHTSKTLILRDEGSRGGEGRATPAGDGPLGAIAPNGQLDGRNDVHGVRYGTVPLCTYILDTMISCKLILPPARCKAWDIWCQCGQEMALSTHDKACCFG
jgi:hypothetical protein